MKTPSCLFLEFLFKCSKRLFLAFLRFTEDCWICKANLSLSQKSPYMFRPVNQWFCRTVLKEVKRISRLGLQEWGSCERGKVHEGIFPIQQSGVWSNWPSVKMLRAKWHQARHMSHRTSCQDLVQCTLVRGTWESRHTRAHTPRCPCFTLSFHDVKVKSTEIHCNVKSTLSVHSFFIYSHNLQKLCSLQLHNKVFCMPWNSLYTNMKKQNKYKYKLIRCPTVSHHVFHWAAGQPLRTKKG